MGAFADDKQRIIRDGLSVELLRILNRATDYVDEMDLADLERVELRAVRSQVEVLHLKLGEIETQIENAIDGDARSMSADLLREALTVRQELLLWMNRGFARIVQVFLPVLFVSPADRVTD